MNKAGGKLKVLSCPTRHVASGMAAVQWGLVDVAGVHLAPSDSVGVSDQPASTFCKLSALS